MNKTVEEIIKDLQGFVKLQKQNNIPAKMPKEKEWVNEAVQKDKHCPKTPNEIFPWTIFESAFLIFAIPAFIISLICVLTINDIYGKIISEIFLVVSSLYTLILLSIFIYNHVICEILYFRYRRKNAKLEKKYIEQYYDILIKKEELISKFSQYKKIVLENAIDFIRIFKNGEANNLEEAINIFTDKKQKEEEIQELLDSVFTNNED